MGALQISGIEGFPRYDHYTETQSTNLVEEHRRLAAEFGVDSPYFNFTDKREALYVRQQLPDGVTLQIGRIGAFSTNQIAQSLNEQVASYVIGKTMGPEYPGDLGANKDLMAIMMGGIDENRLVVLFEHTKDGDTAPIAGVQAYLGSSKVPLREAFSSDDEQELTIATLQSLRTTEKGVEAAAFQEFLRLYGDMSESQVVGMSRLFKRGNRQLAEMGIKESDQAWDAMAALIVGVQILAVEGDNALPQVMVYDTHTDHIQNKLESLFGMKAILTSDMFVARPAVTKNVLKYHYGGDGVANSLFQDVRVGYATDGDFLAGAVSRMYRQYGINILEWIGEHNEQEAISVDDSYIMAKKVANFA